MKYYIALIFGLCIFSTTITAQVLSGTASYYHPKFVGRKTATGDIFSNKKLTCACNRLPLNTMVRVTNIKNGKSVDVLVNDRLAKNNKRVVDLSQAAAKKIDMMQAGLTKVNVEVLSKPKKRSKPRTKKVMEEMEMADK